MSICVLLSKIVEALDIQGDEDSSYLDKNTGEVISLRFEDFNAAEDGESLDDYARGSVKISKQQERFSTTATKTTCLYLQNSTFTSTR